MSRRICALLVLVSCSCFSAHAQSAADLPTAPGPDPDTPTLRNIPRNLLHDQAGIWTSPAHMSDGEFMGSIFFVAAAGALGSEDRHIMQSHFLDPTTNSHASTASTGLVGVLAAAPFGYYGFGYLRNDDKARQTGILAGEAIADSLAVNQIIKVVSRRERPTLDDARGKFFQSGVGFNSSFASNHSVVAWSSASVIASESNNFLLKLTVYGLASGVSVTRVVGRDHFPSDVFVGSGIGWLIGHYVYHRHNREAWD